MVVVKLLSALIVTCCYRMPKLDNNRQSKTSIMYPPQTKDQCVE